MLRHKRVWFFCCWALGGGGGGGGAGGEGRVLTKEKERREKRERGVKERERKKGRAPSSSRALPRGCGPCTPAGGTSSCARSNPTAREEAAAKGRVWFESEGWW